MSLLCQSASSSKPKKTWSVMNESVKTTLELIDTQFYSTLVVEKTQTNCFLPANPEADSSKI